MKWNKIKNSISKLWSHIKNDPVGTYKDIKNFVKKHESIGQAYSAAKLALEGAVPEAIPLIEAIEKGGKFLDQYIVSEQGSKNIKNVVDIVDRATKGNRFI